MDVGGDAALVALLGFAGAAASVAAAEAGANKERIERDAHKAYHKQLQKKDGACTQHADGNARWRASRLELDHVAHVRDLGARLTIAKQTMERTRGQLAFLRSKAQALEPHASVKQADE